MVSNILYLLFMQIDRNHRVGCGYFEWYDGPMSERARVLLNELKEERKMLLAEKMEFNERARSNLNADVDDLWSEIRELKKAWLMKTEEVESAKKKFIATCIIVVLPWLLLIAYMVVFR